MSSNLELHPHEKVVIEAKPTAKIIPYWTIIYGMRILTGFITWLFSQIVWIVSLVLSLIAYVIVLPITATFVYCTLSQKKGDICDLNTYYSADFEKYFLQVTEIPFVNKLLHFHITDVVLSGVIIVFLAFFVVLLLWFIVRYPFYEYSVTNQRCILKHGLLSYNKTIVPFNRIVEISIKQNILEKILNIRSLYLTEISVENNLVNSPFNVKTRGFQFMPGLTEEDAEKMLTLISQYLSSVSLPLTSALKDPDSITSNKESTQPSTSWPQN